MKSLGRFIDSRSIRSLGISLLLLPSSLMAHEIDLQQLAAKLFKHQCSSEGENLAFWNAREAFSSFGIGHFVWEYNKPHGLLEDHFPDLPLELTLKGVARPSWLNPERDQFLAGWIARLCSYLQ